MQLLPPEGLGPEHRLGSFRCTHPSLAKWLLDKALANQEKGASKCYVVCDAESGPGVVVGYYSLSAGSVERAKAPGGLRKNMPDPGPVALLGRLAVHEDYTRRGIGSGLLKDATTRCLHPALAMGVAAILCHAIDADAKAFYLRHGFIQSPVEDMTVMLPLRGLLARQLTERSSGRSISESIGQ